MATVPHVSLLADYEHAKSEYERWKAECSRLKALISLTKATTRQNDSSEAYRERYAKLHGVYPPKTSNTLSSGLKTLMDEFNKPE